MKRLTAIIIICLAPVASMAQQYGLSFSSGYYWGINTKSTGTYAAANGTNPVAYSLGAGTITNASLMVQLDSHFMIHAGASYLEGNNALSNRINNPAIDESGYTSLTAWQLQAKVTIGYRIYVRQVQAYFNIGLLLPVMGRIKETSAYNDSGRQTSYTAVIKNKPGIGFTSALGARIRLSSSISLFGELQTSLMNLSVNSKKITSYHDYKGRSLETAYPTTYDREVHYLKNVEDVSINDKVVNPKGYDTGKPRETLTSKNPYSNLGFNIGLIFHF